MLHDEAVDHELYNAKCRVIYPHHNSNKFELFFSDLSCFEELYSSILDKSGWGLRGCAVEMAHLKG